MSDNKARRAPAPTQGTTTIIGQGVKISGTIAGTGSFIVCGEVESDCDLDGPVTLAKEGCWKGTIKASSVTIAGRVEGDVRTNGRIEVASTAYVRGSLIGRMISVDGGAVIEGEMQMTGNAKPAARAAEKITV